MARDKREAYRLQNERFLESISKEKGVYSLRAGVLYKVLELGMEIPPLLPEALLRVITREPSYPVKYSTIPLYVRAQRHSV